ncbi:hypothetical protein EVA_13144 [gut metagenome]|uniref:Uncharacterized protein n=1 Tax=gut metagenome TaxID=749906 RepID=J9CFG4_9ZZZZ
MLSLLEAGAGLGVESHHREAHKVINGLFGFRNLIYGYYPPIELLNF